MDSRNVFTELSNEKYQNSLNVRAWQKHMGSLPVSSATTIKNVFIPHLRWLLLNIGSGERGGVQEQEQGREQKGWVQGVYPPPSYVRKKCLEYWGLDISNSKLIYPKIENSQVYFVGREGIVSSCF
jgi:hypothetical protein